MKSAYELAMERSGGATPPLSEQQKQEIADIRRKAEAKVAEQSMLFDQRIAEARAKGDVETFEKAVENRQTELRRIRERAEAEVERVRSSGQT